MEEVAVIQAKVWAFLLSISWVMAVLFATLWAVGWSDRSCLVSLVSLAISFILVLLKPGKMQV